ncbi:MAG TPA: segregation/condensation protein A [Phycisphaerae bacterium]|nr:segregation/condensation protein A [Phycisphaerae bacterium]
MADYRVQTDVYNGPLDLLLFLIRREEVDIYDIPIARVTQQYIDYVDAIKSIDPNVAGEFLVMAATLMEIKSRMLLPRPPVEEGEEEDLSDPRLELVRQLLEYKKFKDASLELTSAAQEAAMRWPRNPDKPQRESAIDLEDVQIWDLVAVFNKLMAAIGAGAATHDVVFDDTPIALHAADILDRLQGENGEIAFTDIFTGRSKVEMIGLFLALLELMRQKRVRITQAGIFAPICVTLLSAEPIEIGDEWAPALRESLLGENREPENARAADDSPRTIASEPADDEDEGFEELDRIKTDVNVDEILARASKPDA